MDSVDLRLLRLFAVIVEGGGFAAAQAELNLSLSTISGHLSDLEKRLGVRLCRRGRAGFAVTEEGAAVYEEARRLFAGLESFDRRVQGLRSRMSGAIALGVADNTLTDPRARLDRVIARFCESAPDVSITLVTRPPNELLRDVVDGHLQLAVASFPRVALGLAYDDLYVEQQRFYCGRDHPLFGVDDGAIDIGEIRRHRIVARSYWGARDLKLFALSAAGATVSDMEAEARLILSGAFLGYLPEHFAGRFVEQGLMRAIRPELLSYRAPFQVAYDARVSARPAIAHMLALVRDELGASERRAGAERPAGDKGNGPKDLRQDRPFRRGARADRA